MHHSLKACSKEYVLFTSVSPSCDEEPIQSNRHAKFISSFLPGNTQRKHVLCQRAVWLWGRGEQFSTYRDCGAGRVCPIARGGERSQGPAASISPIERGRLALVNTGALLPPPPGGPQGNRAFFVKQMIQIRSVKMWKCSARARVNKHYTAGWLLFKLNRYSQTSRKWMGWSILLISH